MTRLMHEGVSKRTARILLALTVALTLCTFINNYDYNVFRHWVIAVAILGVLDVYSAWGILGHVYRIVYPPLAPLLFVASVYPLFVLNPQSFLLPYPQLPLRILAKTPIIASLLAGYYLLERRVDEKAARLLVSTPLLILLATAYVFDLPAAIAAAAAYIYLSQPLVAGLLLATATLLKQNFVVLAVPAVLHYLSRGEHRKLLTFIAAYLGASLAIAAPFVAASGIQPILYQLLLFHTDRPPQGATLWTLALVESGYNADFAARVARLWLYVFIALTLYALYRVRRVISTEEGALLAAALVITALLLSIKVVNPHYILWLLPLLAILIARGVIDGRAYLAFNVAGFADLLYPLLASFSSAVLQMPLYLEEERRWLSPPEVEKLVVNAMPEVMPHIINFARHNILVRTLLEAIYVNWWLTAPILAVLYTASLAYLYALLLKAVSVVEKKG